MKILVIDDSEPSRRLIEAMLRAIGYADVGGVPSALDAIAMLTQESGVGVMPDLILMDVVMPDMDGIEATRQIKAISGLEDIPIIVVTAEGSMQKLEQAFDAGATDYINKPINKVELRGRVRSVLRLKHEMDQRKEREAVLLDLTQRLEQANNELQRLSGLDGLTGIANRRHFDQVLLKEWQRLARTGQSIALLMLDIDFFKGYNDTYGHLQGDVCLQQVAKAIAGALRRPADLAARYGGEEFVVVLPDTDANGALTIAHSIQEAVHQLSIPHSKSSTGFVSISIGVAGVVPMPHKVPTMLLQLADAALYEAKKNGRNRMHLSADCESLSI